MVEGINFVIGFDRKENPAIECARQLGIKLSIFDVIDEFKQVIIAPRHGYGANLNPCLDCKIFMVRKAMAMIKKGNFDFIITGEVIGQRPKSQFRHAMEVLAEESGAYDLLLRPLCAKCLAPTLPEINGWVNRNLLYNFNGRSRKSQINLAKELGLENYSQPAGGCLLTDNNFCQRMRHLWKYRKKKDYSRIDLELLKIGRHISPHLSYKIIVGRNETENKILEKLGKNFVLLYPIDCSGPIVLLDGIFDAADINLAGKIAARYSDSHNKKLVKLQIQLTCGTKYLLEVTPFTAQDILPEWFI